MSNFQASTRTIENPNSKVAPSLLHEEQRQTLSEMGQTILDALKLVATAADQQLRSRANSEYRDVLAGGPNPMVHGQTAQNNIRGIDKTTRENLSKITKEPFIARVEWQDEETGDISTLYTVRGSAADVGSSIPGAYVASYHANLGKLAELKAGDIESIKINGQERDIKIISRVQLQPHVSNGEWDALDDNFEFLEWDFYLDSLVKFLKQNPELRQDVSAEIEYIERIQKQISEDSIAQSIRKRKFIDQMALRDQPILDKFQGSVFRMPLDSQVFLFGPPGSGKTTTLIRRLAHKKTQEAITPEEKSLLPEHMYDALFRNDSWAMFSPTELLKLYLADAFHREGIPAVSQGNIRTWDKERKDLGRNVLGILKSGTTGRFQYDVNLKPLQNSSSQGICNLYDALSEFHEETLLKQCDHNLSILLASNDSPASNKAKSIQRSLGESAKFTIGKVIDLFDDREDLHSDLKRFDDKIEKQQKHIVGQLLTAHTQKIIQDIVEKIPYVLGEIIEEEDSDLEEIEETPTSANPQGQAINLLMSSIKSIGRAYAENKRVSGRSARILEILGERHPDKESLIQIGHDIIIRASIRALIQAPRSYVMNVPASYTKFRKSHIKNNQFYVSEAIAAAEKGKVSSEEIDILILLMLVNTRKILEHGQSQRLHLDTRKDWLEKIKNRYLMQVFVDEATDFSAVELACTLELSHPTIRSWFACGDLRQRITLSGLKSSTEINWINKITGTDIKAHDINIGYRQSLRLRELASAFSELEDGARLITHAPHNQFDADIWPLLSENKSGSDLAKWLTARIIEIEKDVTCLPSISIFVDGDDKIAPLVKVLEPLLSEHNIGVVGCEEGRAVGDNQEVRVFDIRYIKGLEFEAAFFVGIDKMQQRIPDLFQRFLYVGMTRPATYLGLTCEASLPKILSPIKSHLSDKDWAKSTV